MRLKKDIIDFISITFIVKHGGKVFLNITACQKLIFVKTIQIQNEECEEILIISKNFKKFKNKILSLKLMIPPN